MKRRPPTTSKDDLLAERIFSALVTRLVRELEKPQKHNPFFIADRRVGPTEAYFFRLFKQARELERLLALPENRYRPCLWCSKLFLPRRQDQQCCCEAHSAAHRKAVYRHSPKGKAHRRKQRKKRREREKKEAKAVKAPRRRVSSGKKKARKKN